MVFDCKRSDECRYFILLIFSWFIFYVISHIRQFSSAPDRAKASLSQFRPVLQTKLPDCLPGGSGLITHTPDHTWLGFSRLIYS